MIRTRLTLDGDFVIGELDRRVFGAFVEHLGRCVYTGIYEPGHATADENGFRRDVLELTRELGATIVRYPGGNFVSGYDWEDGVGPREQRPVRLDLAWHSTETNQFGTNEFIAWCRAAGVGQDTPHAVRSWCLGNEMDAPWQIGQKTADEYGRLARDSARLMRWTAPGLELTACGSSNRDLPTFGAWEYQVLEQCFDEVDFLSVHAYFENPHADTWEFLGNIDRMDLHIREVAAVADAVAARRHSLKRIALAVDEWNIWYKARAGEHAYQSGWPRAPRLIEEVYNFEDALAAGGALSVLMNNADRVKTACLAQLVNAIGAIRSEPGGPAWRQTIFHPFALAARHARGVVLRPVIESPSRAGRMAPDMAYLVTSATHDASSRRTAVFALNRNLGEEQELEVRLRGLDPDLTLVDAQELFHEDMQAANTVDAPGRVAPRRHEDARAGDGVLRARLKPGSWNVFVLAHGREHAGRASR
jgi:alpha-N-arabinofuranosidase